MGNNKILDNSSLKTTITIHKNSYRLHTDIQDLTIGIYLNTVVGYAGETPASPTVKTPVLYLDAVYIG